MPGLKVRAPVFIKYSLEKDPVGVTRLNKVVTVDPMSTNWHHYRKRQSHRHGDYMNRGKALH